MLKKIVEDVFLVQGENNGRFPYSNSILILDEHENALLIEEGCGIDLLRKIREEYNVKMIITSHTSKTPKTIVELVENAPIYGAFPYAELLLRYWEGEMIKKHLNELILQNKVEKLSDNTFKRK